MAQKGFPTVMSAHFGNNGSFAYRDTVSALGITWEPVKYADEWSAPSFTYPATEAEISPTKIKIKEITKIGIAVKNLEETMKNYWNLLSIGPWDVLDCRPPGWHGQTYHGKSTNHTMRADLNMIGPVELELIQPGAGDSIYRDYICEHGGNRLYSLQSG